LCWFDGLISVAQVALIATLFRVACVTSYDAGETNHAMPTSHGGAQAAALA
jgi:hypothetical protein